MKPLSEQALREKIEKILKDNGCNAINEEAGCDQTVYALVSLVLQDRKAWGEHNSKSAEAVNYMISVWDEVIPRWRDTPDHVQQKFIEVERQRNQGEKTDE